MSQVISFEAQKHPTRPVVTAYKDGDAVIILHTDGSQLADVLKLMTLPPDELFRVTIKVELPS